MSEITIKEIDETSVSYGNGSVDSDGSNDDFLVSQSKTVSPSDVRQIIVPDKGYNALSQVIVQPIPKGSATIPDTYIEITPAVIVDTDGTVTAAVNADRGIAPAVYPGYVSTGTPGTLNVRGNTTLNLSKLEEHEYIPTTTDQTIPAQNWLAGDQIVKGDENLVPENIAEGVRIFDVLGTHVGGSTAVVQENVNYTVNHSGNSIEVTPETGFTAMEKVTLNVPAGSVETPNNVVISANPSIELNSLTGVITANTSASQGVAPSITTAGYVPIGSGTSRNISVSGSSTYNLATQAAKTITPTESSQTAVVAGKYTTGDVTVGAISSDYVGSGITRNDSSDLEASGKTVNVPAGYYASNASKSVADGSATTPATTITANPTINVNSSGKITASVSTSKSVTPTVSEGYVSSGAAGTITVSGSAEQNLTTLGATTYTPGTTDQTIASGKYLTGTQTIKGDPNLLAGNIVNNVTIFGVTGSYAGSSSDPNVQQQKSYTANQAGTDMTINPDSGYTSIGQVLLTVPAGSATTPTTTITSNPTISIDEETGILTASYNKEQSITPTVSSGYVNNGTAGTITTTGSATYDLSDYIGIDIPNRFSLSSSGKTVTASSGYYPNDVSTNVASGYIEITGSVTIPPTISVNSETGEVTSEITDHTLEIPTALQPGWITGVRSNSFSISGTATQALPTQAAVTITPTEQTQTIESGKYLTGNITIDPISSSYVGSAIPRKDSSNLSESGATVTVPAGYYATNATKTITSGTASTPATTITSNPTISIDGETGILTASYTKEQNVAPTVSPGYVSNGTAGKITTTGSSTYNLSDYIGPDVPTQDSLSISGRTVTASAGYYAADTTADVALGSVTIGNKSITANPTVTIDSETGEITATVSGSTTVSPTVSAGYVNSGTAGTVTISGSKTQQLTTQAATTITPSDEVQTIEAGKYLTGDITVEAVDSNFVGSSVPRPSSLSRSGATVTAPAGYYPTNTSLTVPSASISMPASLSADTGVSKSIGSGTITLSKTGVTNNATVGTAGYAAAGSISGTSNLSLQASLTTKAAETITPGTTDKTIASGTYLTGVQTIKGDANLVSANILSGKTIFGVSGSVVVPTLEENKTYSVSNSGTVEITPTTGNSAMEKVTLTVPSGTATSAASISGTAATITAGTNTIKLTKTVSNIPRITTPGYISTGTAGNSTVELTANVNTNNSDSLTASGATVTAPAGYYAASASKSVTTMSLPTTIDASATSGYTSKATVSRSTSDQYINIPTGYNTAGAYYKISAVANGTAGTPTATKSVDTTNNVATVTPSVTNTTGYITGSTKTGTAVTVDINELGTVGVSNGGTGLTTITSGSYLKGGASNTVITRTASEVLSDINGVSTSALDIKMGRTDAVTNGNDNYTDLMSRGTKLMEKSVFDAVTNWTSTDAGGGGLVKGAIAWAYE